MSEAINPTFSLRAHHTFGIEAQATNIIEANTIVDVLQFFQNSTPLDYLILGGGSNILFTKDFMGTVLLNRILGYEETYRDEDFVTIKVGSGENWHGLVLKTVALGYGGLENLSLIPGTVGAAPMQNIGAYGAEVKDVIQEVFFYNIERNKMESILAADCNFGYRDSIFKQALYNKIFITAVSFKLNLHPSINVGYEDVKALLRNSSDINVQDVSDAIVSIRTQKLPDPAIMGNSGSFFKNPTISVQDFEILKRRYVCIKGYPGPNGVKVAAGWLIEQTGWKGYRSGDAGVHHKQALVLVNYGDATGKEIVDLSSRIIASVYHKFGISLEREVQVY